MQVTVSDFFLLCTDKRSGRKVMRQATLCTNWQGCCLPFHMAVRLTPAIDSAQVWTCYSSYAIVESVCSEVVFVRCVMKMDRQKLEQHCAIKFCVKLGESATVTYEKLQRAYGEHSPSRAQVLFRRPRRSGRRTSCGKTFNLKDGRQRGKSEVSCEVRSSTDVEIDQKWVKFEPIYRAPNFNTGFGHEKSVRQDGSKEPHDWAEGQLEECVSWSSGLPWERAKILQSCYHWWWIMDFWVPPRDKTPKSGVAHWKLSLSQESENEQIQDQVDAHLFFLTVRGSSTRNLCHQDKLSNILSGSPWKTQEKGGMCPTRHCMHLDAAPRQRPMSHGSLHQWIFGWEKHSCGSSAPLFTGSQSLWLLFIPPAQKPLERAPFLYFG